MAKRYLNEVENRNSGLHPSYPNAKIPQLISPPIMNSMRFARAALRVRPTTFKAPALRRGYAEAVADKIKLSLALPHQSVYRSQDVVSSLVEVIEESGGSKQFFLSGGFAVVQPNSSLSINAVEGFPLEDFSAEAVRSQIAEAQKIVGGNGSEQDIAEAKIELEVLETLQAVLK
ncbi:hypothetical protein DID88_007428 [Monilinia fructigena]|uniref:F1F0-ATP synthase subunit delta C-terminal domain-containing protein n=1 Tax=Monilinia fructigena TaxID=38457 RepID=A0A395J9A3_9HELO|nr:hypothetical protein DID88_007428 [Monilinia fructigena]